MIQRLKDCQLYDPSRGSFMVESKTTWNREKRCYESPVDTLPNGSRSSYANMKEFVMADESS
jgi:hypothetical protein